MAIDWDKMRARQSGTQTSNIDWNKMRDRLPKPTVATVESPGLSVVDRPSYVQPSLSVSPRTTQQNISVAPTRNPFESITRTTSMPGNMSAKDFELNVIPTPELERKKVIYQGMKSEIDKIDQELRGYDLSGNFFTDYKKVIRKEKSLEEVNRLNNLLKARETYENNLKRLNNPGFLEKLDIAFSDLGLRADEYMPFIGMASDVTYAIQQLGLADKVNKGEELSKNEKSRLYKFQAQNFQEVDKNQVDRVISGLAGSLRFMTEMGAASKITGVNKALGSMPEATSLLTKTGARLTGGAIAATASGIPSIASDVIGSAIKDAKGLQPEFMQAYYDNPKNKNSIAETMIRSTLSRMVEGSVEYLGGSIDDLMKTFKVGSAMRYLGLKNMKINAPSIKKVLNTVQFDSLISEILEEEITELGQAPLEKRKYYAPWTKEGSQRLVDEFLTIGIMQGGAMLGGGIESGLRNIGKSTPQSPFGNIDTTPAAPGSTPQIQSPFGNIDATPVQAPKVTGQTPFGNIETVPTEQTAIIDNAKLDPASVKRMYADVVNNPAKADLFTPEVKKEIMNLPTEVDSPGKFYSNVAEVLKRNNAWNEETQAELARTFSDFGMKEMVAIDVYGEQKGAGVNYKPVAEEILKGKEIAKQAQEMGSDQGGISDYLHDEIAREDYKIETISIKELKKLDPDLKEYLTNNKKVRDFEGEPYTMNPIVDSKGMVLDGYNRIHQAIKDGATEIEILRGINNKIETFYTGSNKKVTSENINLADKKTITLQGDQKSMFNVKSYTEADQKLLDKYGKDYDFIILEHPENARKSTEYYDLKRAIWFSKDKEVARAYSFQNRGGKYEGKLATPPKNKVVKEAPTTEKKTLIAPEIEKGEEDARVRMIGDEEKTIIEKDVKKLPFNKTKLNKLISLTPEFKDNPVLVVSERLVIGGEGAMEKTLAWESIDGRIKFQIKASSLGLEADNLTIGDVIEVSRETLKNPTQEMRVINTAGKYLASKSESKMGNYENRLEKEFGKDSEQFKLFEKAKELIQKYAKTIGEDYLPKGALGVYYGGTENIRVKGMNQLSVVTHEIAHFLDFAYNISKDLLNVVGESSNGRPIYDPATYKTRQEITNIYEHYYPGGKDTHKLRLRVVEGFAVLLEKYSTMPTLITKEYPNLVQDYLTPGGIYYKPVIGDILKDLDKIVKDYQGLTALEQVGARVLDSEMETNKKDWLSLGAKIKTFSSDEVFPLEYLENQANVKNEASNAVRVFGNIASIFTNNIQGKKGYWRFVDGNIKKTLDFNIRDLIEAAGRNAQEFGWYLVARREHFLFERLDSMQNQARELAIQGLELKYAYEGIEDKTSEDAMGILNHINIIKNTLKELKKKIDEAQKILDNDGFTRSEVDKAWSENQDRFSQLEKYYDRLIEEHLNILSDKDVQLMDSSKKSDYLANKGYASFKRAFYDELTYDPNADLLGEVGVGKFKVSRSLSGLKRRSGSEKAIHNPLYSLVIAEAQTQRVAMQQMIRNKLVELSEDEDVRKMGVMQQIEVKAIPDPNTGAIEFPQERDPNIIMGRKGYKRVALLVDPAIKRAVDSALTHQNYDLFAKLFRSTARIFTKGTTELFVGFPLTNITLDQIASAAQTHNKFLPFYDSIKLLYEGTTKNDSKEAKFLQEYLVVGGDRQTLMGYMNMSTNEIIDNMTREKEGVMKMLNILEKGEDILGTPARYSEMATRATEYIKARKNGKSTIESLEDAARVSTPFSHTGYLGGTFGKSFIKSIPFFNPAIQVLTQTMESLNRPETRGRFLFVSALLTATTIAGMAITLSGGSDDQKDAYKDLHPEELSKYIWLPNPDGKSLIKLKIPDQMNIFGTILSMAITDMATNVNYKFGEYFDGSTAFLPQQFNIFEPGRMLTSLIPQIGKPALMTFMGMKDYPNIMPLESPTQQNKPVAERYTKYTAPLAKVIGKLLNISPIKVDYLITGYLGRASRPLLGDFKRLNPLTSLDKKLYLESGRRINNYYKQKETISDAYSFIKKQAKEGKSVDYTTDEIKDIFAKKEIINTADKLIKAYGTVDIEKDPKTAKTLREAIYSTMDQLNK